MIAHRIVMLFFALGITTGCIRGTRLMPPSAHRQAIPSLEQYLAAPGGAHRTEAQVLLEFAQAHQALQAEAQLKEREIAQIRTALGRAQDRPAASATERPAQQPERGLAQEVERLKSELARANQELERIRRRLAGDRP
jgi:predicted RNase H-like nuclease (RuvC/YqgF family)